MNYTPLRYPGGKSLMTNFFIDLFHNNEMNRITYAEPFAGGAGAAVNLLVSDEVDSIIINDANIGIFSFWDTIVKQPEEFIKKVYDTPITLTEWKKQRQIYVNSVKPSLELGFAVFFLSRTNRSGIISAGPIGGSSEEKQLLAKYKIDCRFNKADLIKRLEKIAKRADNIFVYNLDALAFLKTLHKDVFVYLDPPYFTKGQCLYMNHYNAEDHLKLSQALTKSTFKWILSYDDVPEIREMYKEYDLYNFHLSYTAHSTKKGVELITHSKNIVFSENPMIRRDRNNIPLIRI